MKANEMTTELLDKSALEELRPENQLGKTALVLAAVCVAAWFSNTVNGASSQTSDASILSAGQINILLAGNATLTGGTSR